MVFRKIFYLTIIFFLHISSSLAWDDETTHKIITMKAVNNSNIEQYLKYNLGMTNTQFDSLGNEEGGVIGLLQRGSELEDGLDDSNRAKCRASNHFHDPLLPWTDSGLTDTHWFTNFTCSYSDYLPEDIKSNILWATGYKAPVPDGRYEYSNGNQYDWGAARNEYYEYLTGLDSSGNPIIGDRETRLVLCLEYLGMVLHLLQDMSVPAHVRNDFSQGHSDYVGDKQGATLYRGNRFEIYVAGKDSNTSWFNDIIRPKLDEVTLTNIWDTDVFNYDMTSFDPDNPPDPFINVPSQDLLGLAEYTQANFVSEYTIFNNYPFPNINNITNLNEYVNNEIEPVRMQGRDNHMDWIFPLSGVTAVNESICSFVSVTLVADYFFEKNGTNFDYTDFRDFVFLSEIQYEEYAKFLIPRAIGYSAALIDHFFRGSLKITSPDHAVYSITDGAIVDPEINAQTFNYISLNVQNDTPGVVDSDGNVLSYEPLESGHLIAVAKYKKRTDYLPDLSSDPPAKDARESGFSISISQPIAIQSLSSDEAEQFDFDFSSDPIPANITDLYLQVVFKGTLGKEKDTAIAVGLKDLNEPQHICINNSTDRFYLDGSLYTSDEILADADLKNRVTDAEIFYSIFPINDMKYYLSFSYQSDNAPIVHAAYEPLPSGTYGRLILLTDQDTFYGTIHMVSESTGIDVINPVVSINGVVSQEDDNGNFISEADYDQFRGVKYNFSFNHLSVYPDDVGIFTAPWPVFSNDNQKLADYLH